MSLTKQQITEHYLAAFPAFYDFVARNGWTKRELLVLLFPGCELLLRSSRFERCGDLYRTRVE